MFKQLAILAVPTAISMLTTFPLAAERNDREFNMDVSVEGLPPNTPFTIFVLQLPKAPFGVAWYQGDIETDKRGRGGSRFTGIFSDETFTHAPGSGAAPIVHAQGPFPDASLNPIF